MWTLLLAAPWATWPLVIASAVAACLLWAHTYWTRQGVPQTRPRLLLGDLWDSVVQRTTVGSACADIYRKYDPLPYVGFYKFLKPILLLRDPDLIRELLLGNFTSFQHNEIVFPPGKDELFSENPFSASFDRWKGLRARLSQLFSIARVRLAFDDHAESAARLADFVAASVKSGGASHGASLDGRLLARRFTAHASARVLFGIESHSLEPGSDPGPFYEMGNGIFSGGTLNGYRWLALLHCQFLLNFLGHSLASRSTIDFFKKLIRDSVEFRQKEGIMRDDFVQYAAKKVVVDGRVDEALLKEMTSQALNSYVETFDTSSLVVETMLLLLAVHPDKQARLRDELREALPADDQGRPKLTDAINDVPYLDWFIKEAMRLFSPADTLRRTCTKPTEMRSGKHHVSLRPGQTVYVPVDALHHDPAYFEQPDSFEPERFAPAECERRHKMAYLPFGEGPRLCPGYKYALQQIKAAVTALVLRFELTPGPEQVLPPQRDPTALLLGFKGGVWLRFREVA